MRSRHVGAQIATAGTETGRPRMIFFPAAARSSLLPFGWPRPGIVAAARPIATTGTETGRLRMIFFPAAACSSCRSLLPAVRVTDTESPCDGLYKNALVFLDGKRAKLVQKNCITGDHSTKKLYL